MNRFLAPWLLFLLCFIFLNSNGQSNIDWTVNQLRLLSPGEYKVMRCFEELPDKFSVKTENGIMSSYKTGSMSEYMHEGDRFDCLSDIETNVHELNHLITSDYPYEYCRQNNHIFKEKNMYYFYIDQSNEMVVFSNVNYFPSGDLKSEIPERIQTFRFKTYIDGNTSTQSDGLLGLLDEYNSYHHSLTTVWEMKEAYLCATDNKVNG